MCMCGLKRTYTYVYNVMYDICIATSYYPHATTHTHLSLYHIIHLSIIFSLGTILIHILKKGILLLHILCITRYYVCFCESLHTHIFHISYFLSNGIFCHSIFSIFPPFFFCSSLYSFTNRRNVS